MMDKKWLNAMEYVENGTTQSVFQQLYIQTKNGSVAIAVQYNYTHDCSVCFCINYIFES